MKAAMRRLLTLFSGVAFFTCPASSDPTACRINPPYRQHRIITFTISTEAELERIRTILTTYCEIKSLTDDGIHLHQQALLVVTPQQFKALRSASTTAPGKQSHLDSIPSITVVSEDLEATLAAAPKQRSGYERRQFATTRDNPSVLRLDEDFYDHFSTFEDLANKWSELAQLYSPHVTQQVIGRSYEGRDIIALRIGKTNPDNPRRIFLNGLQHAREWIATHVPTYIAETLAVSAATGEDELGRLLNDVEVIIVPLINPDGYIYSHSSFRLQRKNRRQAGCPTKQNDGVDLNRNWGKNFSGGDTPGVDPCSETFFGTTAFSEPETSAVRTLFSETPGIEAHLDFHSFGRLVLSPWSYTDDAQDKPPREKENCNLGTAVGEEMTKSHGLQYTFGKGTELYTVGGTMTDWVADQSILSFTIELRPHLGMDSSGFLGKGFLLEEEEILPTCHEGLEAVKTLLRFTNDPNSVSQRCSQSENILLPNPDNNGDRTDIGGSGIDLAFVLGISLGGLLFVILFVLIIIVARRANRNPASVQDPETRSVNSSEYPETVVSADEELARISSAST